MKYSVSLKIKNSDDSTSKWISDIHADSELTVVAAASACMAKVQIAPTCELTDVELTINGTQKADAYIINRMDKISYTATIKKK